MLSSDTHERTALETHTLAFSCALTHAHTTHPRALLHTHTRKQMVTFQYLLHRTYVFEKLVVKRTFYRYVFVRAYVYV